MNKLPLLVLTLLIHQFFAGSHAENAICQAALSEFETSMNDKPIHEQCKAIPALESLFRKHDCKMGTGIFAYVNFCKIFYNEP